jgi:hypothetical protein
MNDETVGWLDAGVGLGFGLGVEIDDVVGVRGEKVGGKLSDLLKYELVTECSCFGIFHV